MTLWSEIDGVSLDLSNATPEQISQMLPKIDEETHTRLLMDMDAAIAQAKEQQKTLEFAKRLLTLVLLRIIKI